MSLVFSWPPPPIIMPFCIDVLLVVDESGVVRVVLLSGVVMVVRVVFFYTKIIDNSL